MRSPTFTRVAGAMLLARAISLSDLWYWRDNIINVSPGRNDVDEVAAEWPAAAPHGGAAWRLVLPVLAGAS